MSENHEVELHAVDKAGWTDGPWMHEPDKLQWVDERTKLDCLIVRNDSGNLCGYVGVQKGHPFYGINYSECALNVCEDGYCDHTPDNQVQVHGGLTYSGFCRGHICHVPEAGRPDNVYWLGFDCGHGGDLTPKYTSYRSNRSALSFLDDGIYRDVEYVKEQCTRLAEQLAALGAAA